MTTWTSFFAIARHALAAAGLAAALLLAAAWPTPAAAQQAPFIYYSGTAAGTTAMIGGAFFADIPPYVILTRDPGGPAVAGASSAGVHYIQAAEVWAYDGTYQFLTTTPWMDCAPYGGGFTYYVTAYDLGTNQFTNTVAVDLCSEAYG